MSVLEKLDKTIAFAQDTVEKAQLACARLSNIQTEEISYVNRAANKRKFLVIKSASGGELMDPKTVAKQDETTQTDETQKAEMLPKAVKEAMAKTLTEVIERIVSVARAIKDAEETDAEGAGVSAKLGEELHSIMGALGSLLEKYPSPKAAEAEGEADVGKADLLLPTAIREAASRLYSCCYDDKSDEATMKAKVSDICSALMGHVGVKAAAAPAEPPKADEEAKPAAACKTEETKTEETTETETETETTKQDETVAKTAEPNPQLASLLEQVSALTAAVATLQKSAEPPPASETKEPAVDMDAISKKIDALALENAELKTKLAKAEELPPTRASVTETKKNDDGAGPRVFPLYYGDPVHDPQGSQAV